MMKRKQYPGGTSTTVRYTDAVLARVEQRDLGGDSRYVISISSDRVIERDMWGLAWREQLDHTPGSVQMGRFKSGRAAFLADHDETRQIGTLQNARLDPDGVLRAEVQWGVSDEAKQRKAEIDSGTGVGTNVSVGYIPKRWKLVEENQELGDLWVSRLWEPLEASSVAIPADTSVGFGRSKDGPVLYPVETEEDETMKRVKGEGGVVVEVGDEDPRPAIASTEAHPRNRNAESAEIVGMCASRGITPKREWFERDMTPDQVARELFNGMVTPGGMTAPAAEVPEQAVDLSDREADEYSVGKVILMAAGMRKHEGLEAEISDTIAKTLPGGYRAHENAYFIPVRLSRPSRPRAKRTGLDTLTPGSGSEFVIDRPGEFIDLLRPATTVVRLGARLITGLSGNVQFPKKTGSGSAYWMKENPGADVTEANLTTGLVTASPKTLMATQSYSRQFIAQIPSMGLDGEAMVRSDLVTTHALAIDAAALGGSGANGEPLGLYHNPDVGVVDYTDVPDWPETCEIVGSLAAANVPLDGAAWLAHTSLAAVMMATLKSAVAGATYLWEGSLENGTIAGYRAMATTQMPHDIGDGTDYGIIFGLWRELLILSWNAMEVIVDPLALKKRGMVEITSFELCDIVCRQPLAFNCAPGADLS